MRETTAAFFALNRPLVYFVYGLVFFVLGISILLQSRSHSRLYLARRLTWLALFGIVHGLHEWGDLFIPIQSAYLSRPSYSVLLLAHQLLLVVSYLCLFLFAVGLLRPLPRSWTWARWLPMAALVVWAFVVMVVLRPESAAEASAYSSVVARYLIGFPAAILAGTALIRRARQLVAPLDDARTVRLLRLIGVAMLCYAVAAGLVVPPAAFFPADRLNSAVIERAFGVPAPVYRSLIALVIAVAVIRTLDVFDLEIDRTLSAIEETQVIEAERARLSRDLHDRALQSVYAAGLVVASSLETHKRAGEPSTVDALTRAVSALDRAVEELRSHIAQLRSPPTAVRLAEGLSGVIRGSAVEALATTTISADVPDDVELSPRVVGHFLAVASEALSNVARHSGAQHVSIVASVAGGILSLRITDDGRGLPVDYVGGYGIANMHERARLLGGELQIVTTPGRGTRLELAVPLVDAERPAIT